MLNPFAEVVGHYLARLKKWSPIVTRRGANTFTVAMKSPEHLRPRSLTFFGSESEIAIAHRAPNAHFSDEIRIRNTRRPLPDQQRFRIHRWPDAPALVRAIGPLVFIADTAARQTKNCAAANTEIAANRSKHATYAPRPGDTLASRRIDDGTSLQREFDPGGVASRHELWLAYSAHRAAA
jgi:hypothetical protein